MKQRFSSEIEVDALRKLKLARISYLNPIFGAYRGSFPGVKLGGGERMRLTTYLHIVLSLKNE
jgi:hypothetical protein